MTDLPSLPLDRRSLIRGGAAPDQAAAVEREGRQIGHAPLYARRVAFPQHLLQLPAGTVEAGFHRLFGDAQYLRDLRLAHALDPAQQNHLAQRHRQRRYRRLDPGDASAGLGRPFGVGRGVGDMGGVLDRPGEAEKATDGTAARPVMAFVDRDPRDPAAKGPASVSSSSSTA